MISSEFLTFFRTRSDPERRKNCKGFQTIRGSGRSLLLFATVLTQDGACAEMQLLWDLQSDFISQAQQRECRPYFRTASALATPLSPTMTSASIKSIKQTYSIVINWCYRWDEFKVEAVAWRPKKCQFELIILCLHSNAAPLFLFPPSQSSWMWTGPASLIYSTFRDWGEFTSLFLLAEIKSILMNWKMRCAPWCSGVTIQADDLSNAGFGRNLCFVMQHAAVHVGVQLVHIGCRHFRVGKKCIVIGFYCNFSTKT